MRLGAFSLSLNVRDLSASAEFYEKLGFSRFGGDQTQGWLIMKSGETVLGLFQGMIPANTLTFSPGWDQSAKTLADFDDVRAIQRDLKAKGLVLDSEADETGSGPASFTLRDPDGNYILFDQYV